AFGEAAAFLFQPARLVPQGSDEHVEVSAGPRERERVGDRLVACHAESLGQCGYGDPQSAQSLLDAFVVVGAEERLAAARVQKIGDVPLAERAAVVDVA